MARITTTLRTPDEQLFTGEVTFKPSPNLLQLHGGHTVSAAPIICQVAAGALDQILDGGNYLFIAPWTKPVRIAVPETAATLELQTLVTSGASPILTVEVGLPPGGDVGDVMEKTGDEDYSASWRSSSVSRNVIAGDVGKSYRAIAGVLRNDGTGWKCLVDSAHDKAGVVAECAIVGADIVVTFDETFGRVISVVVAPDESFSLYEIVTGPSVDKDKMRIPLRMRAKGIINLNTMTVDSSSSWLGVQTVTEPMGGVFRLTTRVMNSVGTKFISLKGRGINYPDYITFHGDGSNSVDFTPYRTCRGLLWRNAAGALEFKTEDGGWLPEHVTSMVWEEQTPGDGNWYLKVTHPTRKDLLLVDPVVKNEPTSPVISTVIASPQTASTTWFRFLDFGGALMESLPNSCGCSVNLGPCIYKRGTIEFDAGVVAILPDTVSSAIANLWFIGIFEKA